MMSDMLLTIQQVAEKYQVSRETVSSWVKSGDLVAVNIGTVARKILRFSPDELSRFERARMTKPSQDVAIPDGPAYV